MSSIPAPLGRFYLRPMHPRSPHEKGRVASVLELFYDLVFAAAILFAGTELHHTLGHGEFMHGAVNYLLVMFYIWWVWMNFSWFSTSFDTDDWLYRVLTITQMLGVLIIAGSMEQIFAGNLLMALIGYIIMRLCQVLQWLRAARRGGRAPLIYAAGITIIQLAWVVFVLWVPWLAPILIIGELAVPIIAERTGGTPWNSHHITERYGLLTLMVLGESLRAAAIAFSHASGEHGVPALYGVALLALIVAAGMWWVYFWAPHHHSVNQDRFMSSLRYGYLHYFIFAAAGAFAAGVEIIIDMMLHLNHIKEYQAGLALAVPVSVFLLATRFVVRHPGIPLAVSIALPATGVLIILEGFLPFPLMFIALTIMVLVTLLVLYQPVLEGAEGTESKKDSSPAGA